MKNQNIQRQLEKITDDDRDEMFLFMKRIKKEKEQADLDKRDLAKEHN